MTVYEYAKTLTPTEEEKFKDLIEECAERESQIQASVVKGMAAAEEYTKQEDQLRRTLTDVSHALDDLRATMLDIYLRILLNPSVIH